VFICTSVLAHEKLHLDSKRFW